MAKKHSLVDPARKSRTQSLLEALFGYHALSDDAMGVPNSVGAEHYFNGRLSYVPRPCLLDASYCPEEGGLNWDALVGFRAVLKATVRDIDALLTPLEEENDSGS